MRHKDIPDKLSPPEHFMEIENYDVRLAVLKMDDFLETLGDASMSLLYSDKAEHENAEQQELNIIRRVHIRHALIDFNNCFDILLQIPWFYYRAWNEFNKGYSLYKPRRDGNLKQVIRNTDGWVETAEGNCIYARVREFLESRSEQEIIDFKDKLETFNTTFRFNKNKKVVTREIVNQIKHKNSLKIAEMIPAYNVNFEINGVNTNLEKLKESNLYLEIKREFYEEDTKQNLGEIILNFKDGLAIDINYNSGEKFRAQDYLKSELVYTFDELYDELVDYKDAIIDLYYELYDLIEPNLVLNPAFNGTVNKGASKSINLDKYFKA
ncbi:hypothetical protein [Bacillus sp. PK3_68]|uniref:hypothetical protein n=1 Tax=Bacillus sp. PK3_68 TaxID=2027408 RepID=UPI000E75791F|nr:hypothetical protein [Bacillus sp. PK3_68]RJS62408.1 hypothetical protein CJ483_22135 [Bacillus sp. PK3_68]